MLQRCHLLLLLLCCAIGLQAAKVHEILIETPAVNANQPVLEQIVRQTVNLKPGVEYSVTQLSADLKALMKTGNFLNVTTRLTPLSNGDLDVTYIVTPRPVVQAIRFQGNQAFKSPRLLALVHHETGIPVNEVTLASDRSAILEKYQRSGYFGTEVTTLRDSNPDGSITVTFVIKEELRRKLHKVYFEGNTVFPESELRDIVMTRRQWWRYVLRFGNFFNKEQLSFDNERLRSAYRELGYLDFNVEEVKVVPLEDNEKWVDVTFVLSEGPQYRVRNVSLLGATTIPAKTLLERTVMKSGDVYDSRKENEDIQRMRAEYDRMGYLDLRLWATYSKETGNALVDITYQMQEGTPVTIRNIFFSGNELTQDKVVRRELAIAPGDKGDQTKINASKSRLLNLGYFESVEVLPVTTEDPNLRDLKISLTEKPTGQLSLGAGFSTEDSAIAFLEFSETNFDKSRLFQWPPKGAGERFRARLQLGDHNTNLLLSHTEPWFLDRRLELNTEFSFQTRDEDEYEQKTFRAGQTISWPVALRIPFTDHIEHWTMGIGYYFQHEKIDDVDKHSEASAVYKKDCIPDYCLRDDERSEWANRLIYTLTRDTRNAYRFPTSGSLFQFDLELLSKAIGSYDNYARIGLSYTQYMPVYQDLVLKLNASYNTSTAGDKTALFDRYFAGGIGTVRGFKHREVGPEDRFEDPVGGSSCLTGTVELIKPVKDFLFASVFLDAGNVWWDDFKSDLGDLNTSIGCGIQFRYLPIAIYYGYPISTSWDHLDGKSGRLHFNIGISY